MTDDVKDRLAAAGVVAGSLIAYFLTLEAGPYWVDSALFSVSVTQLGLPHPPGFPSYVALAHLAGRWMPGNPSQQVAAVSALCAAGSVAIVFHAARALLASRFGATAGLARGAAAAASLCLAFSYSFWSQAINAEQFQFTTLAMTAAFAVLLRLDRTLAAEGVRANIAGPVLRDFALVVGLCVVAGGGHPVSAAILAPCAVAAWRHRAAVLAGGVPVLLVVAGGAVAFVGEYLALGLLSGREAGHGLGDPATRDGLIRHMLGFATENPGIFGPTQLPHSALPLLARILELAGASFTVPALAAILAGLLLVFLRDRLLAAMLGAYAAAHWILNLWQMTGNQESTFLPLFASLAIPLAAALASGAQALRLAPAILLVAALLPLARWGPALDRSSHVWPYEFGRNLLDPLPPETMLVTATDVPAPYYILFAEHRRPDVSLVITPAVLGHPFARAELARVHPELSLRGFQASLANRPGDLGSALLTLIVENARSRHVHVTPDVARTLPLPRPLAYEPYGLTYRVTQTPSFDERAWDFRFADPGLASRRPEYLELPYAVSFAAMLSRYGEAYGALALAAADAKRPEIAARAVADARRFSAAAAEILDPWVARFPAPPPSAAQAFGVRMGP